MNRLITYLRDARAELGQVTWPTRQTAIRLSITVLALTAVLAAFLGAFDVLFAYLLRLAVTRSLN